MSGNDFLEKAHNKVLAEAEQLRAEVNRLQADVTRLRADVAHWQATAEAEQLRAQAAEVERDSIVVALKNLASYHEGYHLGMGPCVCGPHKVARELIAEVTKKETS
jgi:cell division septum initiation protein DivIVA